MRKAGKQSILTIIGIALSFLIAIGGWLLINELINRKEKVLFSATGIVYVDTPIAALTDTDEENNAEKSNAPPELTDLEIAAVVQNWENGGQARPHEPTEGQLSMEQAIEAGREGLSYFCEYGIIPAELLENEFDRINAYLCENQPKGQEVQSLAPYYSYWTVTYKIKNTHIPAVDAQTAETLMTEYTEITLIINAVTGQIWSATIPVLPLYSDSDTISTVRVIEADKVLDAFTSYLGIGDGDSSMTDGFTAARGFAQGGFYAIARNDSVDTYDGGNYQIISFYLSSQSAM